MAYLVYARSGGERLRRASDRLPPGYDLKEWKPGLLRWTPPVPEWKRFMAYSAFYHLHLFGNRDYSIVLIRAGDSVVHHSCVNPPDPRYPFMAPADLQIGDVWTAAEHRGRGLAVEALRWIVAHKDQPGRRFWYVTAEDNLSSMRAAEKAGFGLVGTATRSLRGGLLPVYEMTAPAGAGVQVK